MNLAKKTFISLGVVGLVVCFGLVLISNWNVLGWRAMSVPTGSMDPAIPPGSMVFMHSVPNSSLKVGDVITYANPKNIQSTISHRIIKAYKIDGKVPAYITKGDANPTADPIPVVGGQVKGKIIGHVPHLGTWMTWGKGWPAIILMVYIPALLIIVEQISSLSEYYRRVKHYQVPGFRAVPAKSTASKLRNRAAFASSVILSLFVIVPVAHALLVSNPVSLGPNHLTIASNNPNPPTNPCQNAGNNSNTNINTTVNNSNSTNSTNNTNISLNNTSSQTSTSGSASVNNNTNGGSATSGNASNCNSTNITVNVTN